MPFLFGRERPKENGTSRVFWTPSRRLKDASGSNGVFERRICTNADYFHEPAHVGDIEARRGELIMLRDRLQAAGKHHAARSIMVALSTFFRWLQDSEIVLSNPAARIGLVKSFAELGRDRAPTLQELGNIWRAADTALSPVSATYMKVLIFTALRREEAALIQWSWLCLDDSEPSLTIPGDVTKNHQEHEIPLTPPVVELFRALPRLSDDANSFVFTSDGKRHIGGHSKNKQAMEMAMKEADEEVADWRFHDFRRAFSSYANEHDLADNDTIEAALNHVGHKSGVRRVYDRSKRLAQRRRLMLAWTEAVIAAVERRELAANVVRIFQ